MGENTMFDIDEQMQRWRRELSNAEVCHFSDLEELEIHMRDEMESLGDKGLSNEEAFFVASRRLGDGTNLTHEFAKVNTHTIFLKRLLWVCIGVLASILIPKIAATFTQGIALGALRLGMTQPDLYILIPSLQIITLMLGVLTTIFFIKQYSDYSTSPTWRNPFKNKLSFFMVLALVDIGILLMPLVLTIVAARYFSAHDFGKIAMAKMYVNMFSPIIMSLLIIGLAVKLAPSRRKVETS
jgi:O-antigen/teichoic acid export membrane protein